MTTADVYLAEDRIIDNASDLTEDMTFEELINEIDQANHLLEQVQAAISTYKFELMSRLDAEKINAKIVGNWTIKKVVRTNFDIDIEKARELGAIKMKEMVDTDMLKIMASNGVEIPRKTIEFLEVKEFGGIEYGG